MVIDAATFPQAGLESGQPARIVKRADAPGRSFAVRSGLPTNALWGMV
jgi:hypothetical protein